MTTAIKANQIFVSVEAKVTSQVRHFVAMVSEEEWAPTTTFKITDADGTKATVVLEHELAIKAADAIKIDAKVLITAGSYDNDKNGLLLVRATAIAIVL